MAYHQTTLRQLWDILAPGHKARLIVFCDGVESFGDDDDRIISTSNQLGEFPRQWEAFADMRVILLNYHTDKGYYYIVVLGEK